jgi:hypothetical protein
MSMEVTTEIGQLRDRLNVAERNVTILHELLKPLLKANGLAAPDLLHSVHSTRCSQASLAIRSQRLPRRSAPRCRPLPTDQWDGAAPGRHVLNRPGIELASGRTSRI